MEVYSLGVEPIQEEEENQQKNTQGNQNEPSSQQSDLNYVAEDNQAESSDSQMIVNEDTYIGEFQTEYINQEVYNLFENDGMVTRKDLYTCAKAMGGWTESEVENLMDELDPNHQGDVNEEEFLLILKYI